MLRYALVQQGNRRRWILEHWPHVVETAEVEVQRTLLAASAMDHLTGHESLSL